MEIITYTSTYTGVFNYDRFKDIKELFKSLDLSDNTIKDYIYRLNKFKDFINDNGLSEDILLKYKRFLKYSNFSTSTRNKYLITAKIFLNELKKNSQIKINTDIKLFRQDKKHKRTGLNSEEVKKIIEHLHTTQDTRLKALVSLLLYQGLRQIEIIRLNSEDLDLTTGTARIQGKGQDDKEIIYLHQETIKNLQEYIKQYKITSGALFRNNRGQRLTTRGLRFIVKEIFKQAGINKGLHGFRHFFTTELIKAYNGNIFEVMKYTRHRNIETLQVYNDNLNTLNNIQVFYDTFKDYQF